MALGQLDVGYRPLTPADDVAGLAGQRQALGEFSAASADMAREVAAGQAVVEHTLRAHDTFARLAQSAQKLALDRQQAAHTMKMNEADLSMQQRLMPGKLEAMGLQNEAMRIDNKYAEAEEEASINAQRIQNTIRLDELSVFRNEQVELSSLYSHEQGLRAHVDGGGDVDDYSHPVFTSAKAMAAWKQIVTGIRSSNTAKREDAHQDGITKKLSGLKLKQTKVLEAVDITGKRRFMDAQGNLNDEGEELLDRMSRMNLIGLTEADRKEFIGNATRIHPVSGPSRVGMMTGVSPKRAAGWAEMIEGTMVPTEEGLQELQNRKAQLEEKYGPKQKVVVENPDGTFTTTTTYAPATVGYQDAVDALFKQWEDDALNEGKEMPEEVMLKLRRQARIQEGFNLTGRSRADRQRALDSGKDAFFYEDGKVKFIRDGDSISGGGVGQQEVGSIDTNVNRSNAASVSDNNDGKPTIRDNATTRTLTKNVEYDELNTGYPSETWNKSAWPRLGTFRTQLKAPTSQQDPNDTYGITKGYGMTDKHADIIISSMKKNQNDSGMTKTGGSDIRKQVNGAIDNYSDTYVDPLRQDVDSILKWGKWIAPWRAGDPLAQNMRRTAREYEELISTEVIDAKVKTRDGKKITMKELMAKPANEWEWHTIEWPMARELWGEAATPNAPTEGNVHDPKRKRFYHETSLDPDEYDLGALRLTLESLIREAAVLKELGQYIRYSDERAPAKNNPWPHTLTSKERQAIRDRQRQKELDWSNR